MLANWSFGVQRCLVHKLSSALLAVVAVTFINRMTCLLGTFELLVLCLECTPHLCVGILHLLGRFRNNFIVSQITRSKSCINWIVRHLPLASQLAACYSFGAQSALSGNQPDWQHAEPNFNPDAKP